MFIRISHKVITITLMFSYLTLVACNISKEKTATVKTLQSTPMELTTTMGHKQDYKNGDDIQFLLSLGDDAYIYMFHSDASNKLVQILPSQNRKDNAFTKAYFLTIPDYDKGYRFKVAAPFGDEMVWVFASDVVIDVGELTGVDEVRGLIKGASVDAFGEVTFGFRTYLE